MTSINFKLSFRTLYRNKLYSILNVLGLSIGMACAMLIFLWVQFQVSFDRFHDNGDRIYRVIQDQFYTNGEVFHVSVTPPGLSNILKENVAGISHSTRYSSNQGLLQVNDDKIIEEVQMVDPDFFKIFSFPLMKGEVDRVFENVHSMVISVKMAHKYFGDKDPVGETILLEGKYLFTITGVIKDNPKNTEIKSEFLIPFEIQRELGVNLDDLANNWLTTFVLLSPGVSSDTINSTIEALKKKNYPQSEAVFFLQPLNRIHLFWIWGGGPIKNVRLFSIIAILIILIAAINFTNLSTAMAAKRFTEVGIKKSFGASRKTLITQFLSETLLLSFISLFTALILTESVLPLYNSLLKTELKIDYHNWIIMAGFLGIMLITGLLSGSYPAFFLSSFKPAWILKSKGKLNSRSFLRETLVVIQFGLAIVLIINTIIIKKQQNFLQEKELGIQKDNVLYMPVRGELKNKYALFKTQLAAIPEIKSACFAQHLPTAIWSNSGGYDWQEKPPEVDPLVTQTQVDFDYVKTLGIQMNEGNFYRENLYRDTNNIIINRTFADIIGRDPIVGEIIKKGGTEYKVIGVIEDFNFKSLSRKIEPLVLLSYNPEYNYLLCKVSAENLPKTIKRLENLHNEFNVNYPFEYHFMDEEYDNLYSSEQQQGRIFNIFSFLAIFISCLGLFGLSSFLMTQRTKEIGIRKTNGASPFNIMSLFSKYYIRWVLVSFVIALPVSYYFIHSWLKNYAYRTGISWWVFVLAGCIAFIIALVTVGWQSWKASKKNPVEALRYE